MGKRADHVDRTRRRITEAAVRLHTSVGPSATTMAAVAEEAGVTRLTLYRHFPTKDELFGACMSHWRALHPPPDPDAWRRLGTIEARLERAVTELYRWFSANHDDLYPIYRDIAFTPEATLRVRQANTDVIVDAVIGDATGSAASERRLRAALGHVVSFWTWQSLVVDQGLSVRDATSMAIGFVAVATRLS